jgi:hypothetical protein
MQPSEIKRLLKQAADARATRVFPPLIHMDLVRRHPMEIDHHRYPRISVRGERATEYCLEVHDVANYLGPLGVLLARTIMPRVPDGTGEESKRGGFVLAGGALHHALLYRRGDMYGQGMPDLDLFPVGLSRDKADLLTRRFIALISGYRDRDEALTLQTLRSYPEWSDASDSELLEYYAIMSTLDSLSVATYRTPVAWASPMRRDHEGLAPSCSLMP